MRVKDKVSIITGGGSGIGRATALLFAKEGSKIVLADVDDKAGSDVAERITANGGDSLFVHTDVSKSTDVERMVKSCVERFGRIDILFNNAGINPVGTVVNTTEEVWDRVMAINLKGVFLCSKYVIPIMSKQGGGVIVNMASVCGLVALPDEAAYDASKGGIVILTKAMALDHAKEKIRVNCVCPGNTDTHLIAQYVQQFPDPETVLNTMKNCNAAFKRLIRPEEVASVALFLASEESTGVTGSAYAVDGGWLAT